jgi:hypothetical protein
MDRDYAAADVGEELDGLERFRSGVLRALAEAGILLPRDP